MALSINERGCNMKLNWDGVVTITEETDGTFIVRLDGVPAFRWPTREIAERRAANVIRHQLAKVTK